MINNMGSVGIVSLSTNFAIFNAGGSKDETPRAPEQNNVTIRWLYIYIFIYLFILIFFILYYITLYIYIYFIFILFY